LRGERFKALRVTIEPLLGGPAGAEVWLFGYLARGDWDARSYVDLLANAEVQGTADRLAEELLATGLADDVIGLSQVRWLQCQRGVPIPGGVASAAMRSVCSPRTSHERPLERLAAESPQRPGNAE